MNGGVLGINKSEKTEKLLRQWATDFRANSLPYDQPLLRELTYASDLRILILPQEYNYMQVDYLRVAPKFSMAPRILHLRSLHFQKVHQTLYNQPFDPSVVLPYAVAERINWLYTTDRTLDPMRNKFTPIGGYGAARRFTNRAMRKLRRIVSGFGARSADS